MKNSQRVILETIPNAQTYSFTKDFIPEAVEYATSKVFELMSSYVHDYPTPCSQQLMYGKQKNEYDWTDGFWTGMLWLSYELTGNQLFRAVAEAQYDDYKSRLDHFIGLDHHDIGFLYIPSLVAQYKLTGVQKARKSALRAAKLLSRRYSPKAGIIQVRDCDPQGKFIIDCCMNIPLLFWAAQETGKHRYYLQALQHITQVCNYMIRDDASTYQNFRIDEITGLPLGSTPGQGYSLDSC